MRNRRQRRPGGRGVPRAASLRRPWIVGVSALALVLAFGGLAPGKVRAQETGTQQQALVDPAAGADAEARDDDDEKGQARGISLQGLIPGLDDRVGVGRDRELGFQIRNTAYGTSYGKNKVTYDTFDFWVYRAPHFDVMYYPEEEAQLDEIVAFAENAYDRISSRLAHELSERTPIIFYQTHSEFQQTHVIPLVLPEGVAAFAEPTLNRLVLPVDDPPSELLKLMTHEITHIFEYDFFYGGRVGQALRLRPPNWVMEGLAEHMAADLTSTDEMLLRDVVLRDQIPTLLQMSANRGFFVDYVLGQVVFDYIVEEYGNDGLRIFLQEIRRDLGQDIERDLERAFNVTPGEFNNNFRDYLRNRYLPDVLDHDEAEDFGWAVYENVPELQRPLTFSPALSPEGDQFVAISVDTAELRLDVMRFDLESGRMLANLTEDHRGDYEYIIGQGVTVGFSAGHDLSWSPNGTQVAFFGRTGPTRTLFLLDAMTGEEIAEKRLDLDQAMSPDIGPDGRVAFAAHENGVRDIWIWDPSSDQMLNVTQDDVYDYAPIWSPDGRRLVFASHYLGHKKLFMIDLARPQERVQLTYGQYNDTQPSFSRDGSTLYFSSDRTGTYNVYSLELASGRVAQLTDILHGAFFPHAIPENVSQRGDVLFSAFDSGRYELYTMDRPEPVETFLATEEALPDEEVAQIEAELAEASSVELDQDNISQSPSGGWHISNIQVAGGIASVAGNARILSSTAIEISDLLGNHRIVGVFGSVSNQRNLQGYYFNQRNRLNWGGSGISQRLFFFTIDPVNSEVDLEAFYELDGAEIFASYPFSRDYRVELSAGFYDQAYLGFNRLQGTSGELIIDKRFPDGTYTPLGVALVADKARFREFGPFDGRRLRIDVKASPGFSDHLQFNDVLVDYREYLQLTERSLIAVRLWGAHSFGEDPNVYLMGGLNQLRGFQFLEFSGNTASFLNVEYRFPFIDEVRGGDIAIRDIRGLFFFDMGAAWFEDQGFTFFRDGALEDAVAAFGGGISFNLGPLPLNFYLSQKTDLGGFVEDVGFDFYIGPKF